MASSPTDSNMSLWPRRPEDAFTTGTMAGVEFNRAAGFKRTETGSTPTLCTALGAIGLQLLRFRALCSRPDPEVTISFKTSSRMPMRAAVCLHFRTVMLSLAVNPACVPAVSPGSVIVISQPKCNGPPQRRNLWGKPISLIFIGSAAQPYRTSFKVWPIAAIWPEHLVKPCKEACLQVTII